MKTMSVTRALVELKNLQDRISRAISEGLYISYTIGKGNLEKTPQGVSKVELENTIKGSFDKVEDLMSYRSRLKSAIILSNAKTLVKVGETQMTVAEAIELKSTAAYKQQFLNSIKTQFAQAQSSVSVLNGKLDATIEQLLTQLYGSEKSKIEAETAKAVAEPQRNQKEATLFDPSDVKNKIEKLQSELDILNSEIDFVLSEANARTEITV